METPVQLTRYAIQKALNESPANVYAFYRNNKVRVSDVRSLLWMHKLEVKTYSYGWISPTRVFIWDGKEETADDSL